MQAFLDLFINLFSNQYLYILMMIIHLVTLKTIIEITNIYVLISKQKGLGQM